MKKEITSGPYRAVVGTASMLQRGAYGVEQEVGYEYIAQVENIDDMKVFYEDFTAIAQEYKPLLSALNKRAATLCGLILFEKDGEEVPFPWLDIDAYLNELDYADFLEALNNAARECNAGFFGVTDPNAPQVIITSLDS